MHTAHLTHAFKFVLLIFALHFSEAAEQRNVLTVRVCVSAHKLAKKLIRRWETRTWHRSLFCYPSCV